MSRQAHQRHHSHARHHRKKRHERLSSDCKGFASNDLRAYRTAMNAEPEITRCMKGVAERHGVQLVGLPFRRKSPSSTQEKLYDRPGERNDIDRMYDLVRYTIQMPPRQYSSEGNEILQELKRDGCHVVRVKNYWLNDTRAYNGVNIQLEDRTGTKFELQFHTQQSLELKERMHPLYEEQRVLDRESPRWKELEDKMLEMSHSIRYPKDIEQVR